MDTLLTVIVALIWMAIAALMSIDFTDASWEKRLIEAELAEFVVDSTTEDTTFIIYAEQETK